MEGRVVLVPLKFTSLPKPLPPGQIFGGSPGRSYISVVDAGDAQFRGCLDKDQAVVEVKDFFRFSLGKVES